MEVYQNKKELLEMLKKLTKQEREFYIYKLFYDRTKTNTTTLIEELLPFHPVLFSNLHKILSISITEGNIRTFCLWNRENNPEILENYNNLLKKMSMLSQELNITNSLELSVLYSYLLFKGYLSKTKKNTFSSHDRKLIRGLWFADIMDGKGVCLEVSNMLKDFLMYNNYSSALLDNHFSDKIKIDYNVPLTREYYASSSESYTTKKSTVRANHVFNLIEENNKLYIYDALNLLMFDVTNRDYANLTIGSGQNKLYPYESYGFCIDDKECEVLDKLFTTKDFTSPYTKEDFISTSNVNIELLNSSTSLLEDFYIEARPNIENISEKAGKIKIR